MPERRRPDNETPAGYRDRASALHDQADQARSPETKRNLDEVARCYEILAEHVERRRKPPP